ncbi:helix-turn-helix transcriptional regulator [Proteocatella sphenisci]|uniref:helix-turn-helix transcriptional regulator n=1 Tax=Proteocatella sphenisci TaxID=181070 RepID=UPI00048DDB09|nr:helix-turn-helix transcriptional regulator [Proteocatella sphenisci]
MSIINLSKRQLEIIEIVKESEPVTSETIAGELGLTRAALRSDLSVLTQLGYLAARPKVGYILQRNVKVSSENILNKKVSQVMSIAVVIDEKESLHNAMVKFFLEDVGSIFAVNEKGLSGIISRKDLLKSTIGEKDINSVPVSMAMTRMPNVVTVDENANVPEAINKLIVHEIDSLPVVRASDKLEFTEIVGRFTKTNATKLLAELIKN